MYRHIRKKKSKVSWCIFLKHNYILLMRVILAGDIFPVLFYSVFSIISNYLPYLTASLCSSTSHYDTLTLPTNCITRIPALSDKLHIPNICIIWLIAHSENLGKKLHTPEHLPYPNMHIKETKVIRISWIENFLYLVICIFKPFLFQETSSSILNPSY